MNAANFLESIFSEQEFPKPIQEKIISQFKQVLFSKNDFLLEEGKVAKHYYFVESGFIRSYALNTEGLDISTEFYGPGDIVIDWPSFFLRTATRENIQALSDCVCWQLDFENFQQLFHGIESFRENGRTRLVGSYFELKRNNISMIQDSAKDRYKRLVREKPLIVQNVSLKQIATYLGITDTSLSRIRKEITKE